MTSKMVLCVVDASDRDSLTSVHTSGRVRRLLGIICERLSLHFASLALKLMKANCGLITPMGVRFASMEPTTLTHYEVSISTESSWTNSPTWTQESGPRSSVLH